MTLLLPPFIRMESWKGFSQSIDALYFSLCRDFLFDWVQVIVGGFCKKNLEFLLTFIEESAHIFVASIHPHI